MIRSDVHYCCCVETDLKGDRIEAGRPVRKFFSNSHQKYWLNQACTGGVGEKCLGSGYILKIDAAEFPHGLDE